MTGLRYIMEFDGRIVAAAMDLGTALILAESFAEKFHTNMEPFIYLCVSSIFLPSLSSIFLEKFDISFGIHLLVDNRL